MRLPLRVEVRQAPAFALLFEHGKAEGPRQIDAASDLDAIDDPARRVRWRAWVEAKEEALDEAQAQIYRRQYEALRTMTSGTTWVLQHRPIWSPGAELLGHFLGDNKTLAAAATGVIPSNVMLILSGHHHLFQALTYEFDLPVQVVAGNGGDLGHVHDREREAR